MKENQGKWDKIAKYQKKAFFSPSAEDIKKQAKMWVLVLLKIIYTGHKISFSDLISNFPSPLSIWNKAGFGYTKKNMDNFVALHLRGADRQVCTSRFPSIVPFIAGPYPFLSRFPSRLFELFLITKLYEMWQHFSHLIQVEPAT